MAIHSVTPSWQGYTYVAASHAGINGCIYATLTPSGEYVLTSSGTNIAYIGYVITGVVYYNSPDTMYLPVVIRGIAERARDRV